MLTVLFHVSLVAAVAGQATRLDQRALIEQALNEPTRISLDGVPLGQAMAAITQQTGVRVTMSDATMDLTPNGPRTIVAKVDIANIPLRRALAELFGPLGMTFAVMDDHIQIGPMPALERFGRQPGWAELDALNFLSSVQPGINDKALVALEGRVQFPVGAPDSWPKLAEAIRRVGAGPGDEVLSSACASLGWAWTLEGDHVVVAPVQDHIRRQLQMPISVRANFRPLFDVLQSVGAASGVRIRVEPGALAALPVAMQRNFSLNVSRQPTEQVLDSISAYTGLGYLIDPDGVLFFLAGGSPPLAAEQAAHQIGGASPMAALAPGASSTDPYVAKIVVPVEGGRSIEWLIRASELPDDLRLMRDRDLANLFDAVRQKAAAPKP